MSVAGIEGLIAEAERLPDPAARAVARGIAAAVLDLHAQALARALQVARGCEGGAAVVDAIARDDLVASVLALHGLHPEPLEARARAALERIAPRLESRGVRARVASASLTCVSVHVTGSPEMRAVPAIRAEVEDAILSAAPDAAAVEIEGLPHPPPEGFVPLEKVRALPPAASVSRPGGSP